MNRTLSKIIFFSALALGFSPLLAFAATAQSAIGNASANWAGYVASNNIYTAVGGTWIVPNSSSEINTNSLSMDAAWVGIGGTKSQDLIQAGTQARIQNGAVRYEAWYELLPSNQVIIPISIKAGDSVSVSLTETSANNWHLSFKNNSTGADYETSLYYVSSLSSADWIEEMPVLQSGRSSVFLPLDNFGTVQFTNGYTVSTNGVETISQSGAQSLTMVAGRSQVLAAPSILADNSFSVTRTDNSTSPQPIQVQQNLAYNFRRFRGSGRRIVIYFVR